MHRVLFIALMLILSGCDFSERNIKDLAISSVTKQLKDPDSARFSDVRLKISEDGSAFNVCGQVNAKNSFGAYSGDARFVVAGYKNEQNNEYAIYSSKVDSSPSSPDTDGNGTIFEKMYWNAYCQDKHE